MRLISFSSLHSSSLLHYYCTSTSCRTTVMPTTPNTRQHKHKAIHDITMDKDHTTGRRPCTAIKDKGHNERLSLSWSQSLDVHNNNNNSNRSNHRAANVGGSQDMEAPVRIATVLYCLLCLAVLYGIVALLLLVGLTLLINLYSKSLRCIAFTAFFSP